MKLKRFITDKEFRELQKIGQNKELLNIEAWGSVRNRELKDESKKQIDYINNLLSETMEGFYNFSAFFSTEKIRIQYNWNYDDEKKVSFDGVGYITLNELKEGF